MATTASFLNRPEVRAWGPPIAFFLLGALLILLGAIPSWGKIQDLRGQISAEQDRIKVWEEKSRQLLGLADQSVEIDKQFAVFDQAIASESKVPELLNEVQAISGSCGVKVTTLQFSGGLQKAEGAEEPGPAEDGFQQNAVQEVRLQYASESPIGQLTCLVSALENASRLIDMESLHYSVNVNQETGEELVTAEATLISYYTSVPRLSPDNPIPFSLSGSEFLRNIDLLKNFKTY